MKSNVKRQKEKNRKVFGGRWPVVGVLVGISFFLCTVHWALVTASAQSGGDFEVKKPTVSAGGGKTENGAFVVTTVIGQPAAGGRLTTLPFQIATGFFSANFAPTAANVNVSGRVLNSFGSPVARARVRILGSTGLLQTAITNSFGYFSLNDVPIGETYIIEVVHKRYLFSPQVITVSDEIVDLNFIGVEN